MGRSVVEDPYGDDSQDDQFEETTTSSPIRDVGAGPPKAATPKAATPKPRTPKAATPKAATPARSTIDDDEDDGYDDDFNESPQKPKKTADRPLKIGSLVLSVEQAKLMRVADEDELMARADKHGPVLLANAALAMRSAARNCEGDPLKPPLFPRRSRKARMLWIASDTMNPGFKASGAPGVLPFTKIEVTRQVKSRKGTPMQRKTMVTPRAALLHGSMPMQG